MPEKVMNCSTPASTVSKGVARGHVLCCIAVVFICFMLTCLNLYMMSSTRSVLRSLDARMACVGPVGGRPSPQQHLDAAVGLPALPGLTSPEALQQQQSGADDFILLAPGDLDNAWTTQTGRLLVPVGQPEAEDEDDGWKQMQVQLAAQANAQQRHIEDLHDKLAAQYRARDELQRNHQDLLHEHHQQLAKKDRQLLKEKQRVMKQGARHQDEVRRYQTELDQLKQQMEQSNAQNATSRSPEAVAMVQEVPTTESTAAAASAAPEPTTVVEVSPTNQDDASAAAASAREQAASLDHIFSAVFGPNPGSFFFPSYSVVASKQPSEDADERVKRDLDGDRLERRHRRLSLLASRLGQRRRRHNQDAVSGPIMRIEGGELVPLNEAAVVEPETVRGARRRRLVVGKAARAALQRG